MGHRECIRRSPSADAVQGTREDEHVSEHVRIFQKSGGVSAELILPQRVRQSRQTTEWLVCIN